MAILSFPRDWPRIASAWLTATTLACGAAVEPAESPPPSHAERMADLGWIRYRGAWRTAQEIELIERKDAANLAEKQWTARLARLRRQLDQPETADRAGEEIGEIADPFAVPALAQALVNEPVFQVRARYLESLGRIRSAEAQQVIVTAALDHPDPETRIAAGERLLEIGFEPAVPRLVAALASADNAQVNRAAEVLGRLRAASAILPLIAALETRHAVVTPGPPAGSTSASFSPTGGGGLSLGGGPKQQVAVVRNERVLEALVTITGANFEWDAAAWRAWFTSHRGLPADFDPRRG